MRTAEKTELNRLGCWYDRYLSSWLAPRFAFVPLVVCYAFNCLVYFGTQLLMRHAAPLCMETPLDRLFPFMPVWVWVYIFFVPFWLYGYIRVSRLRHADLDRLVAAHLLCEVACAFFFILLPTTNARPELPQGFSAVALGLIYQLDPPRNLFPSIHCMVSWLCWAGVRGNPRVSRAEHWLLFAGAVCICFSTLFVRQHVLADVFAGIALAETGLAVSRHTGLAPALSRLFAKLELRLFGAVDEQAD